MLTGKQKRYLRSLAHNIDPIFQIGKAGINDNMISQIDETLENRELIKIHILQNNFDDKNDLAQTLSQATNSHKIKPDVFYFLPSYMAPLKEHNDYLDAHYRIKMINMVIEQLGFGNICYAELERKGQSYTYDTLKALIDQNPYDKFYFVIG